MCYYGLRGLSLLYLPYSQFDFSTLSVFALFYGLDWIATVPPIMRLINDRFGKTDAPVVFGWIFVGAPDRRRIDRVPRGSAAR